MATKSKIQFDNDRLKTALATYKEDIAHLTDGECLDDEQLSKVNKFKRLSDVEQSIYYLYVNAGATDAAEILGVSRQYVYKVINNITKKINK